MEIFKKKRLTSIKLRRRAENILKTRHHETDVPLSDVETLRLLHEQQVYQTELELQNAELRQARDEVERVRDKYIDLYDFAPIGYFSLDGIGDIRDVNLSGAELLGMERSRLLGLRFAQFVADEHRLLFVEFLGKVFANQVKESCEVVLTKDGNQLLSVQIEAAALGSGQECRIAVIDITGRKESEKALQLAREEWECTFDSVPDLIAILDVHHRILRVNRAMARCLNLDPSQCVGLPCYTAVHGTCLPPNFCPHSKTLSDCKAHETEVCETLFGGEFLVTTTPLFDSLGNIYATVHMAKDITQLKQTEKALRGKEQKLRLFIEHAPAALAMFDREMRYIQVSNRWRSDYGLGDKELIGKSHYDVFPEITPEWRESHRRGLAGEVLRAEADRFERADGSVQWLRWEIRPWLDAAGNIGGIVIFADDITDTKKAEDILRRYELLALHSHDIILFLRRDDGRILEANSAAVNTYGYSYEELLGLTVKELRAQETVELTDTQMLEADTCGILFETSHRRKDGSTFQVEVSSQGTTINGIRTLISVIRDVTARRRAEQRLDLMAETAGRLLISDSPQEVIETLCQRVMEVLDCHTFFNFIVDEEQGRLRLNSCFGIPEEERKKIEWLDYGVAVCGCVARDACRIVAEDIPPTPDPRTELIKSYGIRAYACHPMMARDRVLGTLSFGTRSRSRFSSDDLTLMKAVADQVAIALERKQTALDLKRSHDQLEQRVVERTEELVESVESLLGEIDTRERAEKSLQRLNSFYAILSETNQAIVHATDRISLFQDFCRIAVENGEFLLSWVGLIDKESGEIRMVASHGATGYLKDLRVTTANDDPAGIGPTGTAVRNGTHYICNDFQNDPCTQPWRERGKEHGFHASASVALKEEGWVVGALTLYAGEKDFFDRQHEELLVQMGADISFALDYLAQEERRQKTEQALREQTLERLRAVEALRKQEHLLIQQNRQAAMGEMIGNIAHQWRQPLNTLGLYTQRLGLFYDSPGFNKEFLDTSIAKSMEIIQYMSRTIDDFRLFFSTEREKSEFRVEEAVTKALSLVEASFKERSITIERQDREDPIIHGFPNEFAQVLLNIFINAKDAMNERNVMFPRLIITIGAENGASVVTIADNAGGIPENIMDKIFDPYFTTKGPKHGTGIGLFMSKAIIENNMGGRLSVQNTDEGAEFRIEV